MASTADRSGNVKFGATAPFILFNNGVQRKTECQRVLPYDLHLHIQLSLSHHHPKSYEFLSIGLFSLRGT